MATQYTKEREARLIERGYIRAGEGWTREQILEHRKTHYVTEMRYTTEVRGVPRYVIWTRPRIFTAPEVEVETAEVEAVVKKKPAKKVAAKKTTKKKEDK